jgi:threonine aldolase
MKEQFITKWSNWWQFNNNAKQLNEAFEKKLNEVIEKEIALRPYAKIASASNYNEVLVALKELQDSFTEAERKTLFED